MKNTARPPTHVKNVSKRSSRPTASVKWSALSASEKAIEVKDAATRSEKADMAASLVQYCATCEKLIVTPNNSSLYCSEACRRKDSRKPLASATSAMSPTTSSIPSASSSPRSILPPRFPTGSSYASTPSTRTPPELHDGNSDLDPTEWKPKIHRRGDSDAYRYLSQFHRPTSALSTGTITPPERPLTHHSATSISSMGVPSLAQTPTMAATSVSTSTEHHGQQYDFNTRPLQLRHNPKYSPSAGTAKSIDLVIPHFTPPAAKSDDEDTWAKRSVTKPVKVAGEEGIGALIRGEKQT